MRRARLIGLAGALAALALPSGPALGFWTAPGTGSATAAAGTLSPATISTPPTAAGAVTVTWTGQAALAPASPASSSITYRVERRSGAGGFASVTSGGCSGALPRGTTSCIDPVPASGSYSYRVVAGLNSWSAVSNEAGPVAVTVDSTPPTVVSIVRTNGEVTADSSVSWTVTFSESVTGVNAADFALVATGGLSGGTVTSVTGSGATRTVTASTGSGSGTLGLNLVDDDTILDTVSNRLGGTGAGNGNATGQTYTFDRRAPVLTSVAMLDTNANGKVDRVTATFDEALASMTATTPWTLTGVPSAGSLASVNTSASTATLIITEGAGAADTAVGSFTVALAAMATGIRDALGNQSSFAATTPLDRASPVPVALSDTSGLLDGRLEQGDTLSATFSEALATGIPSSPTITETRPGSGNATLSITGVTNGALGLGSADYLLLAGSVSVPATANLSAGSRTLTITAGVCSLGCTSLSSGTGTSMVYVPALTLLDTAGNAAAGSRTAGFRIF